MAIILARGWESGHTMLNTVDNSGGAVSGTAKTGSYGLRFQGSNTASQTDWSRWSLSGTPSAVSCSFWFNTANKFSSNNGLEVRYLLGTGEYIDLRWDGTNHTLDAYVDNVKVADGTVEVSVNDWFHVQFSLTVADAGNITVLINGHESINYSGDTQPGAATGATYLYIRSYFVGPGASDYTYCDDLVVGDTATLLGDLRVYDKRPSADDATAQYTPSTGTDNYAMEDETPPSDADYNEAATNGLIDQFELSALDITGFTCEAVQAWSRAKMTDGVGDSIDVGIYSGSTARVNRSALSTAWEYYWGDVEETDPDDAGAWSQAKLDALLHRKVAVIT